MHTSLYKTTGNSLVADSPKNNTALALPAVPALQQKAISGHTPVVQRMIVRIRDLKERIGLSKPTIMDASLNTKKEMGHMPEKHKQDVGIGQVDEGRQLDIGEELRVVAHGSEPSLPGLISSGLPTLGGLEPHKLAKKLQGLFQPGHGGDVFLDGCYTGVRLNFKAQTSYIELFAQALAVLRPDVKVTVRGNLGLAATLSQTGEELVTLPDSIAPVAIRNAWPVIEMVDNKTGKTVYKVRPPYGAAMCNASGFYGDGGLSKAYEEEQKEKALEQQAKIKAENERRANAMSKLRPDQLQTYDDIWNDLL